MERYFYKIYKKKLVLLIHVLNSEKAVLSLAIPEDIPVQQDTVTKDLGGEMFPSF